MTPVGFDYNHIEYGCGRLVSLKGRVMELRPSLHTTAQHLITGDYGLLKLLALLVR